MSLLDALLLTALTFGAGLWFGLALFGLEALVTWWERWRR
jgi:hypothetical protein